MTQVLLALALLTLCAFAAQEAIRPTEKLEQHEWLQQLAGEWAPSSEAITGPDGESTVWEREESTRSSGGLWIVAEGAADIDGQQFTSLMTLGYDPNEGAFVGTWIDTMQTTLSSYRGQLGVGSRARLARAGGTWEHPLDAVCAGPARAGSDAARSRARSPAAGWG